MTATDYAERCEAAADRQGLTPARALLDTAGIDYTLTQTGGFTMALYIEIASGPRYILVTQDAGEYLVGAYSGEGDEGVIEFVDSDDLVDTVYTTLHVPPDPDSALTFDQVEAAGLDGTLRSIA